MVLTFMSLIHFIHKMLKTLHSCVTLPVHPLIWCSQFVLKGLLSIGIFVNWYGLYPFLFLYIPQMRSSGVCCSPSCLSMIQLFYPSCNKLYDFFFSYSYIVFHCVNIQQLLYPFVHRFTFGLFLHPDYYIILSATIDSDVHLSFGISVTVF